MTRKEILTKIRRPENIVVAFPELVIAVGAIACGVGVYSGNSILTRVGLGLMGEGVIPSSVVIYAATHPEVSQQKPPAKA
jgi:hypothetical protein